MANSLSLENDSSLQRGYIKVNGTTAVTLSAGGLDTPQAKIGSLNGLLKATNGTVSQAVSGVDFASAAQGAKAWVNFNGTGTIGTNQTIRSSYNVSSITKNGTGDYTVNFTTPMADANYCVNVTAGYPTTINQKASDGNKTTANVNVFSRDVVTNSQSDATFMNVQVFGN